MYESPGFSLGCCEHRALRGLRVEGRALLDPEVSVLKNFHQFTGGHPCPGITMKRLGQKG